MDKHFSPVVRKAIIEKLKSGRSSREIAEKIGVSEVLVKSLASDVNTELKDYTKLILSYIPDSINVLADVLKSYWDAECITPQQKKLCIDVARDILRNAGLISSDAPSYQVTNYIQNNFSGDITIAIDEFRKKMKFVEEMVKNQREVGYADIEEKTEKATEIVWNSSGD